MNASSKLLPPRVLFQYELGNGFAARVVDLYDEEGCRLLKLEERATDAMGMSMWIALTEGCDSDTADTVKETTIRALSAALDRAALLIDEFTKVSGLPSASPEAHREAIVDFIRAGLDKEGT